MKEKSPRLTSNHATPTVSELASVDDFLYFDIAAASTASRPTLSSISAPAPSARPAHAYPPNAGGRM